MKQKSCKLFINIVFLISLLITIFSGNKVEAFSMDKNYNAYALNIKLPNYNFEYISNIYTLDTSFVPRNDYDNICKNEEAKGTILFIGKIIRIAFWVVPFIIIVLGMVDFTKAMTSNDEKSLGKATSALIKRIVAGLAVAIIPTVVVAIINSIRLLQDKEKTEFNYCLNCLLYPFSDDCNIDVESNNSSQEESPMSN